jgi:hypothetical protein
MLQVTYDLDKIKVRFDHKFCGPHEIMGCTGVHVNESRRCSLATVYINDVFAGKGMAVCHPTDNFCRSIGRKKALANALIPFNKSFRRAIWIEYNIKCGFKIHK